MRSSDYVSVYITENMRGKHLGRKLLDKVIKESENIGIWTLQAEIIELNQANIELHKKCGFRVVGVREKIAQDVEGIWQNTVLMEKRSQTVGI